jgi:hypothetical protein
MKVTSVFIRFLNYACKITWIKFLITLCLVKNSIQISKRKHSVTSRFIWAEKPYKQLELVSHRDIHANTRKQCMKTLALRARVFIHCFLVFGYPGETLALVVHILLLTLVNMDKRQLQCERDVTTCKILAQLHEVLLTFSASTKWS